MRNQSKPGALIRTTPARDRVVQARWQGWCDASAGLAFCADYDRMDQWAQRAYERGRLTAVAVVAAGGEPPKWRRNETAPNMARRIWPEAARTSYAAELAHTSAKADAQ